MLGEMIWTVYHDCNRHVRVVGRTMWGYVCGVGAEISAGGFGEFTIVSQVEGGVLGRIPVYLYWIKGP